VKIHEAVCAKGFGAAGATIDRWNVWMGFAVHAEWNGCWIESGCYWNGTLLGLMMRE